MSTAVRKYYECVDAHDVDGLLQLFAEDAWYERPGYGRLSGRQALRDFYGSGRVILTGSHTLRNLIQRGGRVAVEGRFIGRLKDGSSVEADFADFFLLDGDLIQERRTYFHSPLI